MKSDILELVKSRKEKLAGKEEIENGAEELRQKF
jgi:hypothetical protein